jgi:hypothetical protein
MRVVKKWNCKNWTWNFFNWNWKKLNWNWNTLNWNWNKINWKKVNWIERNWIGIETHWIGIEIKLIGRNWIERMELMPALIGSSGACGWEREGESVDKQQESGRVQLVEAAATDAGKETTE